MDDASGAPAPRADPTDALTPGELAWADAHVGGCPRCAATAAVDVALVAAALREDEVALPDDEFFAARRGAILAAIRSQEAPVTVADRPAPRLVAARPAARSAERAQRAGRAPAASGRSRRRVVLPAALAACLVLGLAAALLRAGGDTGAGPGVEPGGAVATAELDPAELAIADDVWVVASNDLFVAALAATGDDPLSALSDEELEEIEEVFLSTPGWS
jgi:hypothetical protein